MRKAKKSDRPVYGFRRVGDHLVPDMEHDIRALEGVSQGQIVQVDILEFRNKGRHRAYWAMLGDVVDSTECALNARRLHNIVKLKTGLIDVIELPDGTAIGVPDSIAFESLGEDEFVVFFKRAEQWLAETYGYVNKRKKSWPSS